MSIARGQELAGMPPVHTRVMERVAGTEPRHVPERVAQERHEFGFIHLAGSHRELAVVDAALPGCVPIDLHVVRRVGRYCSGFSSTQN